MTSKIEITDAAVEAGYLAQASASSAVVRKILAAALPFCKQDDDDARLHLFDGRFTLPLVVKSYPGVSFIHPADNVSAPVAVITCDDHATIATGIVDAIRAAHDAHVVRGGAPHCLCGDNDGKWCSLPGCPYEKPTNVEIKNGAAFMRANAKALGRVLSGLTGSPDISWAEKARGLFGDQPPATLRTIGAALAEIATRLPGSVYIEVGDSDPEKAPPQNVVTVNIAVNGSVDPEIAQRIADEVRRSVESGLQPSAPVNVARDIVAEELELAKEHLAQAVDTIAKVRAELESTGHVSEGEALHILVDKAIDKEREKYSNSHADMLKARAEGLADAIAKVMTSAPTNPAMGWASQICAELERMREHAENASLRYRVPKDATKATASPAAYIQMVGRGTRAPILASGDLPSVEEMQKLAASVGAVFIPNDKADREKYIASLKARATAFETAIEIVKGAAPRDTGVWSSHRDWALRSVPDLERCMKSASREAALASAGAKV